tara:strand:+ start:2395 stop:4338 length:1944 start_codon:yes stop_codon:yes gene_type:complete
MYNSTVGLVIRDKIRKYEEDKKNLKELTKEVSEATYEKVKAGSFNNKTYPGMLESSYTQIKNILGTRQHGTAFKYLPYFRYGSINLNSSFKELVYFGPTEKVYVKGISRLYEINTGTGAKVYELQDVSWKPATSGFVNLDKEFDLNDEQQKFLECAKSVIKLLVQIKKYNKENEVDQIVIAKNLADYLFNTNERNITLGIEKIQLDKSITIRTPSGIDKEEKYVIDQYDFIDFINVIVNNSTLDEKKLLKKINVINDDKIGNAGEVTLSNLTNGFFWKETKDKKYNDKKYKAKNFFIRQKSKLKVVLKIINALYENVDKGKMIGDLIDNYIDEEIGEFEIVLQGITTIKKKEYKDELKERIQDKKDKITTLENNYNKIYRKISTIKSKIIKISDPEQFKKYKNIIETVEFMKYDIYYEKKLYNKMIETLTNIYGLGSFKIGLFSLYETYKKGVKSVPSVPQLVKMRKPTDVNKILKTIKKNKKTIIENKAQIEKDTSLTGKNQYIVFVRKHGGLMDEYGVLNLTQLHRSGNIKKSIMTQFGKTEIEKYLYNSGYIIVGWSKKIPKDTRKWKILRFDHIFDDISRNMLGKVDKQIIRDKVDKLLTNKSFYVQHTENWVGNHSIKKTINKFCRETSTSFNKCKIVKTVK